MKASIRGRIRQSHHSLYNVKTKAAYSQLQPRPEHIEKGPCEEPIPNSTVAEDTITTEEGTAFRFNIEPELAAEFRHDVHGKLSTTYPSCAATYRLNLSAAQMMASPMRKCAITGSKLPKGKVDSRTYSGDCAD
jgi:hypothetical protein